MSSSSSAVFLRHGMSGKLVSAELYDAILQRHLDDHADCWKPLIVAEGEQHGHWDWEAKWSFFSAQLRFQSFAIECDGRTQGLMIVNTIKRCRIPTQANQHLVYVEYLEAAPWNRRDVPDFVRYKGVGTVMVAAAIQRSRDEGNRGRIGLHSLPQADLFYREKCGMTDLGPDTAYDPHPLRYFEMTEEQAAKFLPQ
ncbi:hypothetical protein M4951_01005 [Blastopirellula sp. J2-11]|uniref:hypothetical protein n=1 Tax=Blastopirellula sp. J2-11 TaxID=2943192 RepID=UPI0021C8378A|nr:hypothetical protein [Blastopirellula sp. J2-11]UUO06906.1 hypothetical protein M4951_01005 [Blastopirellula sp. J2-11]